MSSWSIISWDWKIVGQKLMKKLNEEGLYKPSLKLGKFLFKKDPHHKSINQELVVAYCNSKKSQPCHHFFKNHLRRPASNSEEYRKLLLNIGTFRRMILFFMIIPYLKGFPTLKQAPVTWTIVLLNVFLFFSFKEHQNQTQLAFKDFYENEKLEEAQGLLYAQYVEKKSDHYSSIFNEMSSLALSGDSEFIKRMSYFSLRDSDFLSNGVHANYYGDQVILKYWRLKFTSFLKIISKDPSRKWGLQKDRENEFSWISYQFVHAGYFHIIFNIFFLLIFGKVLESYMGSVFFLLFYLSSGVFGSTII